MISSADAQSLLSDVDVVDVGSGPVVALAHGAGGGVRENFDPVMASLGGRRRFVGPYYPGAGATPRALEPLSLETLADTVVAAATTAGAQRFPVVGMSLGAAVAVTAAVRHPEQVSALVLTVGLVHPDAQVRSFAAVWRRLAHLGEFDTLAQLLVHAAASPATLGTLDLAAWEAAVRDTCAFYPPGGAEHAELVTRVDVRPLLAGVTVPTLVVVAGQDRIVLPDTSRGFATGIAGAHLLTYPDAGHVFTPAEAATWASDIGAFLDGEGT